MCKKHGGSDSPLSLDLRTYETAVPVIVGVTAKYPPETGDIMNRTLKALTAALVTLGLTLVGLPLGGGLGSGGATTMGGSSGCCKN